MRGMIRSATVLVALAGLVGCQPAADDEATSDAPGAATTDATRRDQASIQPALPGLFALMAGLERDMAALSHGLWTADLEQVAESAEAVANHPRIPPGEVEAVAAVLGPDMAAFKATDTEVHEQGLRVAELARRGDFEGVLRAEARLREACVACHTQFRERLRVGMLPDSVRERVVEL
jgi:cytochrome c556